MLFNKKMKKMPYTFKKYFTRQSKKAGMPPGSMVYVGDRKTEKIGFSVIDYNKEKYELLEPERIEETFVHRDTDTVSWINVTGLHDVTVLQKLCDHFSIHPLAAEDILNTDQRPKIDFYEDHIFAVIKMIGYNSGTMNLDIEQVSLIVGKNYLISFQERPGDVFEPLRHRIKNGAIRLRRNSPDYLMYAIMDVIVDHYFFVLERLSEQLEDLDTTVIEDPQREIVHDIQNIKRELLILRRAIWPLRELVSSLLKEEVPLIREGTLPYIRDLYDHIIQVTESIEILRDMGTNILDLYHSHISNSMNEVMKILTLVATIFIPLTFIAGIYGMNFEYMPELAVRWAYPALLLIMAAVAGVMVYLFRRKHWL